MKNEASCADRLIILNDDGNSGTIAVREKVSIDLDSEKKIVKFHDFSYSVDEVIALADKLKSLGLSNNGLTFT